MEFLMERRIGNEGRWRSKGEVVRKGEIFAMFLKSLPLASRNAISFLSSLVAAGEASTISHRAMGPLSGNSLSERRKSTASANSTLVNSNHTFPSPPPPPAPLHATRKYKSSSSSSLHILITFNLERLSLPSLYLLLLLFRNSKIKRGKKEIDRRRGSEDKVGQNVDKI